MKTVYKYPIFSLGIPNGYELPLNANVVHFEKQNESMCFWAEVTVNETTLTTTRWFQVFGTGHEIPMQSTYVATAQDGLYVLHLYELSAPQGAAGKAGQE
jgi:hypothetical protein